MCFQVPTVPKSLHKQNLSANQLVFKILIAEGANHCLRYIVQPLLPFMIDVNTLDVPGETYCVPHQKYFHQYCMTRWLPTYQVVLHPHWSAYKKHHLGYQLYSLMNLISSSLRSTLLVRPVLFRGSSPPPGSIVHLHRHPPLIKGTVCVLHRQDDLDFESWSDPPVRVFNHSPHRL